METEGEIKLFKLKNILILILFLCCACSNIDKTELTFYKIGKADCTLIVEKDKVILIDTGEEDDASEIISDIKKKGIKKIDYLILSHYDKDHIGSAGEIISEFDIGRIFGPDYDEDSKYYMNLLDSIKRKDYLFEKLTEDLSIDNILIKVAKKEYENRNDMSLIVKVIDHEITYLFFGDILAEKISDISEEDLSATLIKIPHHGKIEDNSEDLIKKTNSKYAIITCSNKNPESLELIEKLNEYNIQPLLTRMGNIVCVSDGKLLSCNQKN